MMTSGTWRSRLGHLALLGAVVGGGVVGSTSFASAASPPTLQKVLGSFNHPNEYDDEFRLDFVVRVPHGESITNVSYDWNWDGTVDTAAGFATTAGIGQEYQIIGTTQDGADDLVTITLRGDADGDTACPSSPITATWSVTTASGTGTFTTPQTLDGGNEACPGTGRPLVRLPWDNHWGAPSGNSASGFGAITTDGVILNTENSFVIDAANITGNVADCGITSKVYYQWLTENDQPTALTPTPVALDITSHWDNVSLATILGTQDFTADGPGYYKLYTWPEATSSAGGADCTGRTYTPGNVNDYIQAGSVFYNYVPAATTTTTTTTTSTTTTTAPAASADLQIVKSVSSPNGTEVGDQVTYTLVATNNGPDTATGVVVTDALPSNVTFVSATPSAGTFDAATGTWSVGDLANGGTESLQIVATIVTADPAGTVIDNTASITSSVADPNSANNSSTASMTGTPLVAPFVAAVCALAVAGGFALRRRLRTA